MVGPEGCEILVSKEGVFVQLFMNQEAQGRGA